MKSDKNGLWVQILRWQKIIWDFIKLKRNWITLEIMIWTPGRNLLYPAIVAFSSCSYIVWHFEIYYVQSSVLSHSRGNNEIGRERRGNPKIEGGLIPWKFVISDTDQCIQSDIRTFIGLHISHSKFPCHATSRRLVAEINVLHTSILSMYEMSRFIIITSFINIYILLNFQLLYILLNFYPFIIMIINIIIFILFYFIFILHSNKNFGAILIYGIS